MNDVLTHELIHAYDFARVKYDVNNLRHLACTEVRSECFYLCMHARLVHGLRCYGFTILTARQ